MKKTLVSPSWAASHRNGGWLHVSDGALRARTAKLGALHWPVAIGPLSVRVLPPRPCHPGSQTSWQHRLGRQESHWTCLFFGNVTEKWLKDNPQPHGHERIARGKDYAALAAGDFPSFCTNGRCAWQADTTNPVTLRLLEVWERSHGNILIHPSRNRFRWVADDETRSLLHDLATTPPNMCNDRAYAERLKHLPELKPIVRAGAPTVATKRVVP